MFTPGGGEVNFDVSHNDPADDVQTIDENGDLNPALGHEDIDILRISSSKMALKQNLILEFTVAGVIVDNGNFSYSLNVMDGMETIYMISYTNGVCTGFSISGSDTRPTEDVLLATGAGTDTLKITLPQKNFDEPDEFDLTGSASEFAANDDEFFIFLDFVPDDAFPWDGTGDDWNDLDIIILGPVDGSAAFGTIDIKGISNRDDHEIVSVEVQVDSEQPSGWREADSDDDWYTWRASWDTTSAAEGRHIIHARAYDGEEYYTDSISVYVDQTQASSPDIMKQTELHVGDRYTYALKAEMDTQDMFESMIMSGSMTMTVKSIEKLNANGKEYEVYVIDMTADQKIDMGEYSYKTVMDGTRYLRKSDLAIVKEFTRTEMESGFPFGGGDYSEDEHTYDPPKDIYDFPVRVGENWQETYNDSVKSTYTTEDETETEIYTITGSTTFECLRKDTVKVPAGSFETFLIFYYESNSEDIYDDIDYIDSDGDGWSDEDEYYFGTDPQDPDDFPFRDYDGENATTDGNGGSESMYDSGASWDDVGNNYLYSGYTIEYFAPEAGFPVRIEYYDYNRELSFSLDLQSFKYAGKKYGSTSSPSYLSPTSFGMPSVIIIATAAFLAVAVIAAILLVRRKRKREQQAQLSSGLPGEPRVTTYSPTSPAAHITGGRTAFPQAVPIQTLNRQPAIPVQTPAASPGTSPGAQLKKGHPFTTKIQCPGCKRVIDSYSTTRPVAIKCPFCGLQGELK